MSGNTDAITTLLENLNVSNIKENKNKHEVRCSREEGRNPTSVRIDTETLGYICFSTGRKGSIYTFIMERFHKTFPEALQWVTDILNLDKSQFATSIKLPFGGYYKKLIRESEDPELQLPTYSEEILSQYLGKYNTMFIQDHIYMDTQKKFKIGYDSNTMRVTIPQWNMNGELVGIMGRLNSMECDKAMRWLPIIPCARSLTLWGYHSNYAAIQAGRTCLILESEKSVMQMDSMGYHFGLATCTNSISDTQAKYIKALRIENIIVGFDEGVDEEEIRYSAQKLIMRNEMFKNRVGYIYDKEHDILPADSKMSPTDLGAKKLKALMKYKIRWIKN